MNYAYYIVNINISPVLQKLRCRGVATGTGLPASESACMWSHRRRRSGRRDGRDPGRRRPPRTGCLKGLKGSDRLGLILQVPVASSGCKAWLQGLAGQGPPGVGVEHPARFHAAVGAAPCLRGTVLPLRQARCRRPGIHALRAAAPGLQRVSSPSWPAGRRNPAHRHGHASTSNAPLMPRLDRCAGRFRPWRKHWSVFRRGSGVLRWVSCPRFSGAFASDAASCARPPRLRCRYSARN